MKRLLFLCIVLFSVLQIQAQKIPYGNNPDAGSFFDAGGVKLYYEIYGQGDPVLLLHGGVYGYIDEFEFLIPELAKNYQVICLATRGHGKSEIGYESFTYKQRAEDALKLIRHLKMNKVKVIGFSDGAFAALKLAALYGDVVEKVIAIGVGDVPKNRKAESDYSAKSLMEESKDYFSELLKIMPEPDRWDESLKMINELYNKDYMSSETFNKIKCPVLLMNGENDMYFTIDRLIKVYKNIPNANLSVIPGCGHVILYCNFPAVWESMKGFLE